jgi:hypothetical protein
MPHRRARRGGRGTLPAAIDLPNPDLLFFWNADNALSRLLPSPSSLVNGLHRLHDEDSEVIHRARTDAAVQIRTVGTDSQPIVRQVGIDELAPLSVDRIHQLGQVHFDTAIFSQRRARRAPWGALRATAADMLANLAQVFLQVLLG